MAVGYVNLRYNNFDFNAVVSFDSTAAEDWTSDQLLWTFADERTFKSGDIYASSNEMLKISKSYMYVDYTTFELKVKTYTYVEEYNTGTSDTETIEQGTGIYLVDGINKINHKVSHVHGPFTGSSTLSSVDVSVYFNGHYIRCYNETNGDLDYNCSNNASAVTPASCAITPTGYASASTRIDIEDDSLDGVFIIAYQALKNLEPSVHLKDIILGTSLTVDDLIYLNELLPYVYFEDVFLDRDDYMSMVDEFRDIALIPSSTFGKNILVQGGQIPGEFEDKYVVVTGPKGFTGETGATGEQGPTGNYNMDGGSAGSIYLPLQNVDGGGA